jgi:restriction system protein
VEQRARDQVEAWNREWEARQLSAFAQQSRDEISGFLRSAVHAPSATWLEALKDQTDFAEAPPVLPAPLELPREPQEIGASLATYAARKDWAVESVTAALSGEASAESAMGHEAETALPTELKLALLHRKSDFPSNEAGSIKAKALRIFREFQRRFETSDDTQGRFQLAKAEWRTRCRELEAQHNDALASYEAALSDWKVRKAAFQEAQNHRNNAVDAFLLRLSKDVGDFFVPALELALMQAPYPAICPREFEITYDGDVGSLIINQQMPVPSDLNPLKEASYNKSKRQLVEKWLSAADLNRLYDELIYQAFLFTAHAVFSLSPECVTTLILNGWIKFVDPATGRNAASCIMSASIERERFEGLNLTRIEPRACFMALRGVSSPNLHNVTPIAPIANVDRTDSRFVESKEVLSSLERGTNVAAIGWEEFEHLIREIFERELSSTGGEVKVTRASRDGGVDAVAFDPDPIRGGKIIIQAKRYTNTVDLSAVRDLYGTVVNEGATKGILVTTSNFGPDAYAFASGKPITLLDGARLLHLLERHGHKGYINLAEAKKLNQTPLARKI